MSAADPETIIRQSMQLFWKRGVDVPFSEIVDATGQSRKTLYSLFGNKATIMGAALGLYRKDVLTPLVSLLEPPHGSAVFWDAFERTTQIPGWNGCLLVRAATAEGRDNDLVQDAFSAYSTQFVTAMKAAYIREGEVGDPQVSAWAAFGLLVSVSVLPGLWQREQGAGLLAAARATNGLAPKLAVDMEPEMEAS